MEKSDTNSSSIKSSFLESKKDKTIFNVMKAMINVDITKKKLKIDSDAYGIPIKKNNNEIIWRRSGTEDKLFEKFLNFGTINDFLSHIYTFNGLKRILGKRKIIDIIKTTDEESKEQFDQFVLSDFEWITVNEFKTKILKLAYFLQLCGIEKNKKIALFAPTQMEWLIMLFAAITVGAKVVTIYSTITENTLMYILNLAKPKYIFTDKNGFERLKNISQRTFKPHTILLIGEDREFGESKDLYNINDNKIIDSINEYIEENNNLYTKKNKSIDKCQSNENLGYIPDNININLEEMFPSYEQINESTKKRAFTIKFIESMVKSDIASKELKAVQNTPEDIALIIFTSGTSGFPKGVLLQHKGVVCTIGSLTHNNKYFTNVVLPAFLPQAHIYEMLTEISVLTNGGCVGFCNPYTLTDNSPFLAPGVKGDLSLLKPNSLILVPLLVEGIKKAIETKLENSSKLKQALFNLGYENSIKRREQRQTASLISNMIFKKVKKTLGGNLKWAMVGGASLTRESEEFLNVCLGIPIKQGYGMTETSGAITFSTIYDYSLGNVGPPLSCIQIKIKDWIEGGYTVNDQPNPRGEVYVSGNNLFFGYYKNKTLTDINFIYDSETDTKWFKTGDIAEMLPDGKLRIIDRKSDIIKMKNGEFVALAQVENSILYSKYVEMCSVFPDADFNHLKAVIVLKAKEIRILADKMKIPYSTVKGLIRDIKINKTIQNSIDTIFKKEKYQEHEIPQRYHFCFDIWNAKNGLLTSTNKPIRTQIRKHYLDII